MGRSVGGGDQEGVRPGPRPCGGTLLELYAVCPGRADTAVLREPGLAIRVTPGSPDHNACRELAQASSKQEVIPMASPDPPTASELADLKAKVPPPSTAQSEGLFNAA